MLLINKQPNAILKFCPKDIPLAQAGGNTVSDLAAQSLIFVLNICALTFHHSAGFFAYIANYLGSLSVLLCGEAVVLPIRIAFQRTDYVILKLSFSCLKNNVVWNYCAIKRAY